MENFDDKKAVKYLLELNEVNPSDAQVMLDLSIEYINWLKKNGVITKLYVAKALNHFTIVKSLSNPRSILTKKIFSMIDSLSNKYENVHLGGCVMYDEDTYCNDCENKWVNN